MAQKKKQNTRSSRSRSTRTAKNLGEATGFSNLLNNEKFDFCLGILLFGLAIYVAIAMGSFFLTGEADQSVLTNTLPGEWLNTNHVFTNVCGSFGAIIAWTLMVLGFGLPAFIIPVFFFCASLRLMGAYKMNLLKLFFGLGVFMLWCSVAFAMFLTPYAGRMLFNPGGEHGVYVVNFVENLVGAPGLTALLVLVAIIFLVVLSAQTITWIRTALRPFGMGRVKVKVKVGTDDSEEETEGEGLTDEIDPNPSEDNVEEENPNEETEPEPGITDEIDEPGEGGDIIVEVNKTHEEKKASKKTVEETIDTSVPINPREPFLRYKFPSLDLLEEYDSDKPHIDMDEVKSNNARIVEVLRSFGVDIRQITATVGPTITLYEVTPAEGVKIKSIRNLEDDIALCLAALGVRIIAPIPGKGTVGIEVPNKKSQIVSMRSLLNSKKFQETSMDLPIALGKTITNEVFMVDLAKIPHLLVAGATGQGKSVGLNAIITSLLYKKHPNELKLVLVDPKKVEFTPYNRIAAHFMASTDENVDEPIITDVSKVVRTLNSLCLLMDTRYDLFKMAGARDIKEYNKKYINHRLRLTDGHSYMPYVVMIIDEFGDLIMTAGKEIELPIARLAQLGRAAGIHLVIATQRPTTNIITGNIKANFPGRMAFRVGAMVDSRTILDRPGANQLVGRGDMLFLNGGEPVRVQGAFIDTTEIEHITEFVSRQSGPQEPMALPEPIDTSGEMGGGTLLGDIDPFFEQAARAIVLTNQGSTSMIQRRFSIGYNRAGRLMDQMEKAGIVGPSLGGKPREVLITDENSLNRLLAQYRQ